MSGTYPPGGQQGSPNPYGPGSANEPAGPPRGSGPGQAGYGPGAAPYGPGPQGGFGGPTEPASGSSAPTYIGPGGQGAAPGQGAGYPGAPVRGGGYPGAPGGPGYGGTPPPGYGGPGGPGPMGPNGPQGTQFGGPPLPPNQPPRKKSNAVLYGVLGGVLALIVIIAVVLAVTLNGGSTDTAGAGGDAASEPAKTKTASDAVQGYLDALAAGDAQKALSYAASEPADKTFLTNAVLKASATDNPISQINVPKVDDEYAYTVSATYLIGDTLVSDDIDVKKIGDQWKVSDVAAEVNVSYLRTTSVPLKVNDTLVNADNIYLFPGTYTMSSGYKTLGYGNGTFTVKTPNDYVSMSDLRLAITAQGKAAFIKAAKAKLAWCVKQKSLNPSGCGFGKKVPDGYKIDKKSIKWQVTDGGDFASFRPDLDYDNPAKADANISVDVKVTVSATQGSRKTTLSGTASLYKVQTDLTKDPLTVTFT